MEGITIQRDIPAPKPRPEAKKYPFDEMEIGDSFAIPDDEGIYANGQSKARQRLSTAARNWVRNNKSNLRFSVCQRIEGGQKVVRAWRLEDQSPLPSPPKEE